MSYYRDLSPAAEGEEIMALAVQEAKLAEGEGNVLNEWYSKGEYIQRRAGFLARNSIFKNWPVFPKARQEADMVYEDESLTLSVQGVREGEMANFIVPLTPMPTSTNVETLDGHTSYGNTEWAAGTVQLPAVARTGAGYVAPAWVLASPPAAWKPETPVIDQVHSVAPRSASAAPSGANIVSDKPSTMRLSSLPPVLPTAETSHEQTANILLDLAWGGRVPWADNSIAAQVVNPPSSKAMQGVLAALQIYEPTPPQSPRPAPVAAFQGRSTNVPVKNPRKRGAPADGDDEFEFDSNSAITSEASASPVKKQKLILKVTPPAQRKKRATKKQKLVLKNSPPEELQRARRSSTAAAATPAATDANRITRIANGAILPKSAQEAVAAQTHRRMQLIVDYQQEQANSTAASSGTPVKKMSRKMTSIKKTSKKTAGSKKSRNRMDRADSPAFAADAEFFNPDNITSVELQDGVVRCICGSRRDTGILGEQWIECPGEICGGIWQHVACVGDAVDADPEVRESDEYEYECHLCDPFRHRRVLQRVRKGLAVQ